MDGAETVESQLHLPIDGETALATPIGDDLALIAGVADAMSDTVEVLLNGDPSMTMRARTISWKRHDAPAEAAIGFVAIVPIRLVGRVRLRSIVMRRNGQPVRYTLVRSALSLAGLMQIVSQDAATQFPEIAEGVAQTLASDKSNEKRMAAALSILTDVARNDGWIEVMGPIDTGEIFLQGWAVDLPSEQVRVLVAHDNLLPAEFRAASVERSDLLGKGRGFIGMLDSGRTTLDPEKLQKLFFRAKDGWRCLDVYNRRVLLPTTDVPAHVRDGLARASASPETLRILRQAGERFDGRDTVSALKQPVRIGMDMVVEVPGGGFLVAGWMLDPDGHAESISLRTGSDSVRIDDTWTRLPRHDVTAAFLHHELFAGRLDPQRSDHGFLAFVPDLSRAGDAPVYFEFKVGESAAFYPLNPARNLSRRSLERLIAPLDPRTAAAGTAIDRHIGPMMQALAAPAISIVESQDFGFDDTMASKAIVVGAGFDVEEVCAALVLLALDPETCSVPIVVSAPLEVFGSMAPEVERLARFYGLKVRMIGADGRPGSLRCPRGRRSGDQSGCAGLPVGGRPAAPGRLAVGHGASLSGAERQSPGQPDHRFRGRFHPVRGNMVRQRRAGTRRPFHRISARRGARFRARGGHGRLHRLLHRLEERHRGGRRVHAVLSRGQRQRARSLPQAAARRNHVGLAAGCRDDFG